MLLGLLQCGQGTQQWHRCTGLVANVTHRQEHRCSTTRNSRVLTEFRDVLHISLFLAVAQQEENSGPAEGPQRDKQHGATHTRAGSACWSTPLPWLRASQGSAGCGPSGWSVQLFREAPREGEGSAIMLALQLDSHLLGKRQKPSPACAHLPDAGCSGQRSSSSLSS